MNDEHMMERIIRFGIPPMGRFNKKNLRILFEDNKNIGTNETGYHCKINDVKFCLYDIAQQCPIFSMNFFACNLELFCLHSEKKYIKLELLYAHNPSYKNNGIASFYIGKLQEYAKENQFLFIKAYPNPDAKISKIIRACQNKI